MKEILDHIPKGTIVVARAARILGCDPAHVRLLVRQGKLRHRGWYRPPRGNGKTRSQRLVSLAEVRTRAKAKGVEAAVPRAKPVRAAPNAARLARLIKTQEALGLSNAAVAEHMGVTRSAISAWKTGKNHPTPANLERWAAALVALDQG